MGGHPSGNVRNHCDTYSTALDNCKTAVLARAHSPGVESLRLISQKVQVRNNDPSEREKICCHY